MSNLARLAFDPNQCRLANHIFAPDSVSTLC